MREHITEAKGMSPGTLWAHSCRRVPHGCQALWRQQAPVPAPWQAVDRRFDGVVAMYHDQGLGPLKTVHFDDAVNLSGGLPHLRVSPDHGPARDLFLERAASPKSFLAALDLAERYLQR